MAKTNEFRKVNFCYESNVKKKNWQIRNVKAAGMYSKH